MVFRYVDVFAKLYIYMCVCVCTSRGVLKLILQFVNKKYIANRYLEVIDFGKSDKMRKIIGKVDKAGIDNGFSNDISSLLGFFSKVQYWRK